MLLFLKILMTNWIFQILGVVSALLFSEVFFVLNVGIYGAAFLYEASHSHRRRLTIVSITVLSIGAAAAVLLIPHFESRQWLILAALHAAIISASALIAATRSIRRSPNQSRLATVGATSLVAALTLAVAAVRDVQPATGFLLLGGYLCMVGTRMLVIAVFPIARGRSLTTSDDPVTLEPANH